MAKVGLLGGTFNPIHVGHLMVAQEALRSFNLDRVLLIPNQIPPHRRGEPSLAPARDRYVMVCLAAAGNAALLPSPLELDRDEVSYTVHTVERLVAAQPQDRFTFITGADSLTKDPWHRLDDVLGLLEAFVVVTRSGYTEAMLHERVATYSLQHPEKIKALSMPTIEVSSTEIRRRIRHKDSITYLVPAAVEDYIWKMGLYQ